MIVAICQIALISNSARRIKVHLRKDNDNLTWNVIESSREGLKLPTDTGTWIAPYDWSNILTLLTNRGSLMLVVYEMEMDFWIGLKGDKTIETTNASLFNGNAREEDVACKFY